MSLNSQKGGGQIKAFPAGAVVVSLSSPRKISWPIAIVMF